MPIKFKEPVELDPTSLDDLLKVVDGNRLRIRAVASMILSVCGMLLSSTFVVLFFILKEKIALSSAVKIILLSTAICLLASAMTGILSALPPKPVLIYGKVELISALMSRYNCEYQYVLASVICLFIGLGAFVSALVVFGVASI